MYFCERRVSVIFFLENLCKEKNNARLKKFFEAKLKQNLFRYNFILTIIVFLPVMSVF